METWFTPASDNDAGDNRHEGEVGEPGLTLERNEVSEDGSEERRGRADGLVKGDREEAEGDVAKDDGDTKYEGESRDFEKLLSRSDSLHRHHLHPRNGDVAEQRTRRHVTHRQEDRILETIVAQQVLVQQQYADVRRVP